MRTQHKSRKHIPLVVGNWKENPSSIVSAEKLASDLKKVITKKNAHAQVCVAAPTPFLSAVSKKIAKTRILLGAQDVSAEAEGAHTGEVSPLMLKSVGVGHVIIGHSERRERGESDALIAQKVFFTLKTGLTAVVCIGERKRDLQGDYFNVVESQLRSILKGIVPSTLSRLVIAYEPVWAIGTGKHATPEDVQEMKLFIQKIIAEVIGRNAVSKVRILYGGSVNKENAESLLVVGKADGFLVGGASLKAAEFAAIVRTADTYGA
jgi:triosephosphate isomerase (TIM)